MADPNTETPNLEQSHTEEPRLASENEYSTPRDAQTEAYRSELAAFERNMQDKGIKLPEQFKSVEDLFNSYRNLQQEYTKSRQELSQLRQEPTPKDTNPSNEAEKPSEASKEQGELRLGSEEKAAQQAAEAQQEAVENSPKVTEADMRQWRNELAARGELSEDTKNAIMQKTGFSSDFVDTFAAGQKALMREAFNEAASIVDGGPKKLKEILSWAKDTLSTEEARVIDEGLQGPSWRTVLMGLEAGYNKAQNQKPVNKEPQKYAIPDAPMPQTNLKPFATRAEYAMARNDPKYRRDERYRQEVEARVMKTNWSAIPYQ